MAINILVGDIGSTKSTWWSNSEANKEFLLPGYNPVTHDAAAGTRMLEQLWHVTEGDFFDHIWYYGTGVVDPKIKSQLSDQIKKFFPRASLTIESDLVGAAIATCGSKEGTVAILGTGSHAAVFDGQQIIRQANSLGFILGDEGGGSDLGKQLIQAYYYGQLPDDLRTAMLEKLPGTRSELLHQFYKSETPNQFLADFVWILAQFQDDPWVKDVITRRFTRFTEIHILPLAPLGPVHVVGSVGTIFAGLLRQVLEDHQLHSGEFVKDPGRRLFEIHLDHE